jgi:hypothetical protein
MMTVASFLIGPIGDGVRKDIKPFATPEDSFDRLLNMFQFRGRLVKRSGVLTLGQLANETPVMGLRTQEQFNIDAQNLIAFDTTTAYLWNGVAFVTLPSVMPVTWNGTDYNFFYSVNYAGALWVTNFDNGGSNTGLNGWKVQLFSAAAGTGTSATVNVTASGNTVAVGDSIYFLNITGTPADLNNLIFATVTAIVTPGSIFTVMATSFPPNIDSFTNGAPTAGLVLDSTQQVTGQDGIKYYGVLSIGTSWANYNPPIDPNNALCGCLLIFPYRGYLVFLNTWEGNDISVFNFGNRARWTQIGTPYYSAPTPQTPNIFAFDPLTARDDLFGRGGANDAPTSEVIVGACFIRDVLVVYFERSTWRLRFVNNSQNPFVWERINVEFGSSSTFSTIPFDKGGMTVGNRGFVLSDGNDTIRFDEKNPDKFFDINQENKGYDRVFGIRTFKTKLCLWTMSTENNPFVYPDEVLVLNYDTKTWSVFDDTFTCFGYYYPGGEGYTWGNLPDAWADYTYLSWNSGYESSLEELIVAGNQQGYVFILETGAANNDPSLTISAITAASPAVFSSINNNLKDGSWISLTGITGMTSDDGVSLNGRNFKVSNPTNDVDDFTINEFKRIDGGLAVGLTYQYIISYQNLIPGSVQINVGTFVFTDPGVNGILVEATLSGTGTINYSTGLISIVFNSSIASTEVWIRIVSYDPLQGLDVVNTIGTYTSGGQIIKISNIDIQTKYFNFFGKNERARLNRIDFYLDATTNGAFTCNVFADSSNEIINTPLSDNPLSNVVLTSQNPYQIGEGDETIYRLYCDALAQTIQIQLTYSDQQMAVNHINQADVQLLAMMVSMRKGGRLV